MSDNKTNRAVMYTRVGRTEQLSDPQPARSMIKELLESANEKGYEKVVMLSTNRVVGTADEVEEIARAFAESGVELDTLDGSHCTAVNPSSLIASTLLGSEDDDDVGEFVDCRGVPGEISMWDSLSFVEGYDDITFAAMELVLEKGVDALMYQLNYDDIERVKEFPAIYQRAIELGIIKE